MGFTDSDLQQDYFRLFDLPPDFALNLTRLEHAYRALQMQVHPDTVAHLSDAERRLAMQYSTRVNEGYQTLRNPLRRGRYLLSLRGVDTQEETNPAMPLDFLMAQMNWREEIADARASANADALEAIEQRLRTETRLLENQLAIALDDAADNALAAELVRKLRFMEKLAEEIHSAYDALDC
jgi:molecular chaperone HscB